MVQKGRFASFGAERRALRAGAARLALFSDEPEKPFSDEGEASACIVKRKRKRSDMMRKSKGEERTSSKLSYGKLGTDVDEAGYIWKQNYDPRRRETMRCGGAFNGSMFQGFLD